MLLQMIDPVFTPIVACSNLMPVYRGGMVCRNRRTTVWRVWISARADSRVVRAGEPFTASAREPRFRSSQCSARLRQAALMTRADDVLAVLDPCAGQLLDSHAGQCLCLHRRDEAGDFRKPVSWTALRLE